MLGIERLHYHLFALLLLSFNATSSPLWAQPPEYLGELTPIWRSQPVIGRWLSGGQGLVTIPEYLLDSSFPYQKRPYAKEVPFADHLLIVRLLGGWNTNLSIGEMSGSKDADVAYRDETGKIRYRWNLLFGRLDPYINMGYSDLTLVLDNIPWDFPVEPSTGKYGQTAPPGNMAEWRQFMRELAEQLVSKYGKKTASRFRFRLGTECQHINRFDGSQEQYTKLYIATLESVRSVLPDSKIGPCNHGGGKGNTARNNIDFALFYQDVERQLVSNLGIVDFFPISNYYIKEAAGSHIKRMLRRKEVNKWYWDIVTEEIAADAVPAREVHESGLIVKSNSGTLGGGGAEGAAWYLKTLIEMYQLGVSRVAHWPALDRLNKKGGHLVLTDQGWVLSVLEHLVGGSMYLYADEEYGTYTIDKLLVQKENAVYLIVSMSGNRSVETDVSVTVPEHLLPDRDEYNIKGVALTRRNSICTIIKEDLVNKDALREGYKGEYSPCANIRKMMKRSGLRIVNDNWDKYQQHMVQSLTLWDASELAREDQGGLIFTTKMEAPSIQVFKVY